jgi:predicted AlkP superfamily pyrophosphatase or phosphodiesterase
MKKVLVILLVFLTNICQAQDKPKLVVALVIDQMRYDYVYRFWDRFEENGFKRLVNEGYFCRNTHFSYMPTYTGPGHASIFTGTTPSIHGIIGNNWYDKESAKSVYCAGDGTTTTVCDCENHSNEDSNYGKMSPRRMLTTTIGDELKLFNPDAKVFGVSLKDRGSILPAGHAANGAFWMDNNGDWISSSYYMDMLPEWLIDHQKNNPASSYFKGNWESNSFNYSLDSMLINKGPGSIKSTPLGNDILTDLSIALMKNEKLGQNSNTDFLSISYSSTDYIGHQYGPHAPELVDTYIKMDKEIAQLLNYIDKKIGKENALVFLTADHGVVSVPNELIKRNIPAGYFIGRRLKEKLNTYLSTIYGEEEWVLKYSNQQFFLNKALIENKNLNNREIQQKCADFLIQKDAINNTFTAYQLHQNEYQNSLHSLIQNGYNQKRSGDVIISLEPGWIEWSYPTGTTHGSHYSYDTHVPLIFWGNKIENGINDSHINIKDIAPTISTLLGISFPNGCTGNPISNITE